MVRDKETKRSWGSHIEGVDGDVDLVVAGWRTGQGELERWWRRRRGTRGRMARRRTRMRRTAEEIAPVTQRLEVTHSRGRFLLATPDPLCAVRCVLSCQRNRAQTNAVWELTATVAH